MTNAELETAIFNLTNEIYALQHDAQYLQYKGIMGNVYSHYNNAPWDKNGNYCWQDSQNVYWCGSDSNVGFQQARNYINGIDKKISDKQGLINQYTNQIKNSGETAAAVAAAPVAAAAQKQKYIFYTVAVVLIAIAVFVYFKWIRK